MLGAEEVGMMASPGAVVEVLLLLVAAIARRRLEALSQANLYVAIVMLAARNRFRRSG